MNDSLGHPPDKAAALSAPWHGHTLRGLAVCNTWDVDRNRSTSDRRAEQQRRTSPDELAAFELATRDLVGLALRSVEHLEVSLPQFRLLLVLQERGCSSSVQVAQALGVVGSSITRAADRLTASGHLRRGVHPANRSIVTLELTAEGRELVSRVTARRRGELQAILDRLDPDERAICAAGLLSVHRELADDVEQPNVLAIPL